MDGHTTTITNPYAPLGRDGGRRPGHRQPDLANYWLRARVYEDGTGRFASRDRAQDEANLYHYVRNRPLVLVDPSGRQPEEGLRL